MAAASREPTSCLRFPAAACQLVLWFKPQPFTEGFHVSGPGRRGSLEGHIIMPRSSCVRAEACACACGHTTLQVYPDAGVAAMLSHQWQDRAFNIASLNDRRWGWDGVGGLSSPEAM